MKVFIQGPGAGAYIMMFLRAGFKGAASVDDADIVCFTGGEDVHPHYYNEDPLRCTYFNLKRDEEDVKVFNRAKEQQKFMVGICRGGQFLNVMGGGKLWQDVDEHGREHWLLDMLTGAKIWVTSTHHQQMIPGDKADVWATANCSNNKYGYGKEWSRKSPEADAFDVEVCWYPHIRALCFQPHPEMYGASEGCINYFFQCLKNAMKIVEEQDECVA
jgi:carbamoylphosphate synthase small subunit